MRKLIAVLVMAMVSAAAIPQGFAAQHLVGKVNRVYPTATGNIYFRLDGACKVSSYFYFKMSSDAGKAWYALLLNAATTQQPVRIALTDPCDPDTIQLVEYIYQDF